MIKRMISRNYISSVLIISLLILSGCGFSSGQYKDILKAQEYITEQKYQKAVNLYEQILTKKPSKTIRIKINYQLGEIRSIYLNQYSKALGNFKKIIEQSEDPLWQVKAMEQIGQINFENLKDYHSAVKSYKNLIDFKPVLQKNDFYKFRYAESMFYMENFETSSELFKQVSASKSEYSTQSYYYLGLISFYRKKWETAVNFWFEYLKREKRKDKIVQTKFMIANAYESSEQLKDAYNIYYSILGEYPNTELIKQRLESLYKRRVARKR